MMQNNKEGDEDEMFFKSLLPQVKKIGQSEKMAFRIKIKQIVDEFAYHSHSMESNPSSTIHSTNILSNKPLLLTNYYGQNIKNLIPTIPASLYLKQFDPPTSQCEVWSLKDIAVGTRFGPCEETFIDCRNNVAKKGFQGKLGQIDKEIMHLGDSSESGSNWLSCVNLTPHKAEANMITFRTKAGVYFIACRSIPANTQLLVHDIYSSIEDIEGFIGRCKKDSGSSRSNDLVTDGQIRKDMVDKKHHLGEKPYEHSACGNKSTFRGTLDQHEKIHTEEKPFKCTAHGEKLPQRNSLITQERIHIGDRPFDCSACGKKFIQRIHLIEHERRHTCEKTFECNVCAKKFTSRHNLYDKPRVHTGEKPYHCNVCGKKFTPKGGVRVNSRVHDDDKTFDCNSCRRKFILKRYLLLHEKVYDSKKYLRATSVEK